MTDSGVIKIEDIRTYAVSHEHPSRRHPNTQQGLPLNTMRFSSITAFAALAFAVEGLSSPKTSPDLRARKIGGACKHSVSQTMVCDHTGDVLTASQGTPGTCQKTSTCANDLGWYSNGDCPNGEQNVTSRSTLNFADYRMTKDPSNVKCCMFTECRKDGVFGHCMNKAGNTCSGGKWYKYVFPDSGVSG